MILWVSNLDWGQVLLSVLLLVFPRAPQAAAVTCQLSRSCIAEDRAGRPFQHAVVFFDHCFLCHVSVLSLPFILH